ncbi:ribonuclease HI [Spirochaetia bacterium 38H-sp]|uniref:Ribonuclease H n=1 Tax=Rarispira pelagica TaxID=3141764 RepID=A0ABU9UC52_9SPIR
MIKVYTDGACKGNPGPGGWAYVVIDGDKGFSAFGRVEDTTNNRMELSAVIEALSFLKSRAYTGSVVLYTDSEYVKKGITEWIVSWQANGWKTSAKKPVKNKDLWISLLELSSLFSLDWCWVEGHAGNKWNELCDSMASSAALGF